MANCKLDFVVFIMAFGFIKSNNKFYKMRKLRNNRKKKKKQKYKDIFIASPELKEYNNFIK